MWGKGGGLRLEEKAGCSKRWWWGREGQGRWESGVKAIAGSLRLINRSNLNQPSVPHHSLWY